MLPLTLAAVHYHPQPVDDCPCFEDAMAVLAVVLGTFNGHWYWARQSAPAPCFDRAYSEDSVIKAVLVGVLRVVVGKSLLIPLRAHQSDLAGIAMIFPWRIIAKNILIQILPPIFRATSVVFDVELPARKHYQQATSDYSGIPPTPIRSMPSFIDLHSGTPPEIDVLSPSGDNTPTNSNSPLLKPGRLPPSRGSSTDSFVSGDGQTGKSREASPVPSVGAGRGKRRTRVDRAKYDAEGEFCCCRLGWGRNKLILAVLTKVGVYAGIGFLVTWASPLVFEMVETSLGL
jgi:hypothetical protein